MKYLTDIYKLAAIKRYSNIFKLHEESVAEHGFFVAAIVLDLAQEYEFNVGEAMIIAVSHDMTEIELNDCPHVIKRKYPSIAKAYEECEADVAALLPPLCAWGAREFDAKERSVEAKIVLLADVIQCIQYSLVEIKMGNEGYMAEVYSNSVKRELMLREELKEYACRRDSKNKTI